MFLHLHGEYNDDADDSDTPKALLYSNDKRLAGFANATITVARVPASDNDCGSLFGTLDRKCFHRWVALGDLEYRSTLFRLCAFGADDHSRRIILHAEGRKSSRNALEYVKENLRYETFF